MSHLRDVAAAFAAQPFRPDGVVFVNHTRRLEQFAPDEIGRDQHQQRTCDEADRRRVSRLVLA